MNAPFAMTGEATSVIRILAGKSAGAEHRLHSGKYIRVGHSFDHDVVLRGPSTKGVSLELHLLDAIATLKVVAGSIDLLGRTINEGESAHLPYFIPVKLGEFAFAIGEPESDRWAEAQSLLSKMAAPVVDSENVEATNANTTNAPAVTSQASAVERLSTRLSPVRDWAEQPRDWSKIGLVAGALALVAIAAGPIWTLANDQINGPSQQQSTLTAIGFKNLKVDKDPTTGQSLITGTLRTDAELTKLRQYAAAKMPGTRVDVETTEGHAAAAKEILNAQGIQGEVKAPALGALTVRSEYLPNDRQSELVKLLKQDLPAVKTISFSVDNALGEKDLQYFFQSSEYGLATFVDGDPSFISTQDGTKWFTGSTLPTGHRIVSMGNGQINFERDGRVEVLKM